jgi:pimeloyl-ACP methyl ester carboxylesterase
VARLFALAAVCGVMFYGAACGYMAHVLTLPVRQPIDRTPAAYGLAYEAVTFTSYGEALRLHGWWVPPVPPRDAPSTTASDRGPTGATSSRRPIVLVHGRGGDRQHELEGRYLELVAALATMGHPVLVFDLRGYGTSEGVRYSLGGREILDVRGAIDSLTARGLAPRGVHLLGHSMGAASALLAAAADPRVMSVAEDSSYAELGEVLEAQVPRLSGLPGWFTPGTLLFTRAFTGVNGYAIRPVEGVPALARRGCGLLVIHGSADEWVPQDHGRRLAAAYGPTAETHYVTGAGHVLSYRTDPPAYLDRLRHFFATADQEGALLPAAE